MDGQVIHHQVVNQQVKRREATLNVHLALPLPG